MDVKHPFWENLFKPADKQKAEIVDLWMATPLFAGIPLRHMASIAESMSIRQYDAGEIIFRTGEIGVGAALIVSGKVSIQSGEQILTTLESGALFGEIALATDETRTADAIAKMKTELAFFMKPDLEDLKNQNPSIAAQIAINLASMLAIRLRHTNQLITANEDE